MDLFCAGLEKEMNMQVVVMRGKVASETTKKNEMRDFAGARKREGPPSAMMKGRSSREEIDMKRESGVQTEGGPSRTERPGDVLSKIHRSLARLIRGTAEQVSRPCDQKDSFGTREAIYKFYIIAVGQEG